MTLGSYFLGILLAFAIVVGAIVESTKNRLIYLSMEALLIVVGGTLAAALLTFPLRRILKLVRVVIAVFQKEVDSGPEIVTEVVRLARETRGDRLLLKDALPRIRTPFLKDGVELIVEKLELERIELILKDRIRVKQETDESNANMLKTLGKYPPAFGLLATVMSLVALLEGLGASDLAASSLGPAMAIGLVGTMYGIILANFVFMPMSENLLLKSTLDLRNRQIVMVGILLLKAEETPRVIQESLNSLLEVSSRVNVLDGEAGREAA